MSKVIYLRVEDELHDQVKKASKGYKGRSVYNVNRMLTDMIHRELGTSASDLESVVEAKRISNLFEAKQGKITADYERKLRAQEAKHQREIAQMQLKVNRLASSDVGVVSTESLRSDIENAILADTQCQRSLNFIIGWCCRTKDRSEHDVREEIESLVRDNVIAYNYSTLQYERITDHKNDEGDFYDEYDEV